MPSIKKIKDRLENPDEQIQISIIYPDMNDLPYKYVAWIEGEKYKGIVVQSDSFNECVKDIVISLEVMARFKRENPEFQ